MATTEVKRVDLTTGIGTFSFPNVFPSPNQKKNDKGEPLFDIQILIPKSQREDARAIMRAIKEVGEAKWGANWKKARTPLRDGDAEKDDLTEDGSTKGEKYPERLGCYFMNARTTKPVGVFDRKLTLIQDSSAVYGGCKGKISVTFYPYAQAGNNGIGVGLNGVQKISDGTPYGGGRPSVESMFDMLDDDDLDEDDLDAVEEEAPEPPKATKKTAAKKSAKRKPKPIEPDEDEDDLYDDLDDDI